MNRTKDDIAGYRLYYGVTSGVYPNQIDAGNNTTGTVSGLIPGTKYFFAATAYDNDGLGSPKSAEVSYIVPNEL